MKNTLKPLDRSGVSLEIVEKQAELSCTTSIRSISDPMTPLSRMNAWAGTPMDFKMNVFQVISPLSPGM